MRAQTSSASSGTAARTGSPPDASRTRELERMKRTSLVAVLALHASVAGAAFKCVDEKGITHFGDTPPAACANVLMLEVTPSGTVLRRIEPTPTAEKLRMMQEENDKARAA